MATDLTKSLNNLKDACQLHCFNLRMYDVNKIGIMTELDINQRIKMCAIIEINGYKIEGIHAMDNEDINMMVDLLINHDFEDLKTVFPQEHKSMYGSLGEYVKESYQFSKGNLLNIFMQALKGSTYARDKFESIEDARMSHVYTVDSAFLYHDKDYITPCILQAVIAEGLKNMRKSNIDLYLQTYGYNKKDYKLITKDILDDYFINDSLERLQYIDQLEGMGV